MYKSIAVFCGSKAGNNPLFMKHTLELGKWMAANKKTLIYGGGSTGIMGAIADSVMERPEMYIVENVPGMRKFKVVMEAMTQLPDYYVNIFCPVDASLWLPQKRKRLILIGTRKPFFILEPSAIKNKPTLKSILEINPLVEMPDYVISRINGKYRDLPIIVDPERMGELAPTCVAHYSKDLGTRLVKDKNAEYGVRPFSIREYARLQGFPDDFHFEQKRSSYRLIGNAVPVQMGEWIGKEAMRYFN